MRGLVRTGLYRRVRRPIFLGEPFSLTGLLLLALRPVGIVAGLAFAVLQLDRASREERTLLSAYPEYAEYRASTARLHPGVY